MLHLGKLAKIWGLNKLFQAEGNSKCKGSEAGTSLMHLRRMSMAGTVLGDETEGSRAQITQMLVGKPRDWVLFQMQGHHCRVKGLGASH